jgi:hypothetical protein
MNGTDLKRTLLRGAAYAGVAGAIYTLSPGNAQAVVSWGPWSGAGPNEYAYCSKAETEWRNPCTGWSWGYGWYLSVRGLTGRGTQGEAYDADYNYLGGTYDWVGGDTTNTDVGSWRGSVMAHHQCRCESTDKF